MLCYLFANSLVWSPTSYICNFFSLTNTFPPKVEKSWKPNICGTAPKKPKQIELAVCDACVSQLVQLLWGDVRPKSETGFVKRNRLLNTGFQVFRKKTTFGVSKLLFPKQSKAWNHCFHSCHRQWQKSLGFDVVFLFQQLCHVFIWISRTAPHMLQCRGTSTTVFHSFSVKEIDKEGFWGKLELIFSQWTFGGKDDFTAGRGGPSSGQWTWRWWWSWWCTRWGLWIVMHIHKRTKTFAELFFNRE